MSPLRKARCATPLSHFGFAVLVLTTQRTVTMEYTGWLKNTDGSKGNQ